MMQRQFLIMSVSSLPRAWLCSYWWWLPDDVDLECNMIYSFILLFLFLVAPQFLVAIVILIEKKRPNDDLNKDDWFTYSFTRDNESFNKKNAGGEIFFENLVVLYCFIFGIGNIISFIKQAIRVYDAASTANESRRRRDVRPLRPLRMIIHWTIAQIRPIIILEVLDFSRIYLCAFILSMLANIPLIGKILARSCYRLVLYLKLWHTIFTALPLRLFALFRPIGWRRVFRLPVDVLSDEADEFERNWLPVIALASRSAAFRRHQRIILQQARHQQMQTNLLTRQFDHNNNPAPFIIQPGGVSQDIVSQSRHRPLTWPTRLPFHPEPPVSDDELEQLSRDAPSHLVCPISLRLPLEPCISISGTTYDRQELEQAVLHNARDPLTFAPCSLHDIRPNYAVRQIIHDFIVQARKHHKEQIQQNHNHTEKNIRLLLPQQNSARLTVRNLVRHLSRLTPQDVYTANSEITAADQPLESGLLLSFGNIDFQDIDNSNDLEDNQETTEKQSRLRKKKRKAATISSPRPSTTVKRVRRRRRRNST